MIGEKVSKTRGNRGDDDAAASDIYATAMVDPESQISVSPATADTTSASTPTTVVTTNKSNRIFRSGGSLSDDDSMSGIYTTYNASMTKEERFRASVLAEERKIRKECSMETGSFETGSFESDPDASFLPKTLITTKTPSPNKKKNQEANWSPFVSSVGTNDFDLDSIASDDSMGGGGGGGFHVLGINSMDASSPRGTDETRGFHTPDSAAVLSYSSSSDDPFPIRIQAAEAGYAGRSRGSGDTLSKAKKKAAAAATLQMRPRPRVCGCRLELIIFVLASVALIAVAAAVGAFIASNHLEDGNASQNRFQTPTISELEPPLAALSIPTAAPSPSLPTPTPSSQVMPTKMASLAPINLFASMTPTPGPTQLEITKGPTMSPAVVVTETASPMGLGAAPGPTSSPVFAPTTQRPTILRRTSVPVTIREFSASMMPTPGPTKFESTDGPTMSPAVVVTETASPMGLGAAPGPTSSPVFVPTTQRPTILRRTTAPVTIGDFSVSMTPSSGPTKLESTKGPTSSPAVAVTESASPTGFVTAPGPTGSPVFVPTTQQPTILRRTSVPVTIGDFMLSTQRPITLRPTAVPFTLADFVPTTQHPTILIRPSAVPVTVEETQSPTAVPVIG